MTTATGLKACGDYARPTSRAGALYDRLWAIGGRR
jgi:hypothetical protein